MKVGKYCVKIYIFKNKIPHHWQTHNRDSVQFRYQFRVLTKEIFFLEMNNYSGYFKKDTPYSLSPLLDLPFPQTYFDLKSGLYSHLIKLFCFSVGSRIHLYSSTLKWFKMTKLKPGLWQQNKIQIKVVVNFCKSRT